VGKELDETLVITLDFGEVHGTWLDLDSAVTEENGYPMKYTLAAMRLSDRPPTDDKETP